MAYPATPSHRMAWDRDGSIGFIIDNGALSQMSAATMLVLNDENMNDGASVYNVDRTYGVVFPQQRELKGVFAIAWTDDGNGSSWQYSTNTTNGQDGVWTALWSAPQVYPTSTEWRSNIHACNIANVTGVRLSMSDYNSSNHCRMFHLYGYNSTGQTPNRLEFWHPTLDQRLGQADLDWGDIGQSTLATTTFRVKNISTRQTANTVQVSMEALTGVNRLGDHQLSDDNVTYGSVLNLGNLASDSISGVKYIKRTTNATATLGPSAMRLIVTAASWT